jgi:DNA-binding LacI/PurR family transcriptional regulator
MTTIAQVAERARVGVGTVSRVLNDSPGVSVNTRARVRRVIDELGYAPNAAARALSTGRTRAIGVVAPLITEPSFVERLRGISRAASAAGYQLVLFSVETPERLAEHAVGGRLDGLLAVSLSPTADLLRRFEAAGVPITLVDAEHSRLPGVSIDDIEGGRIAAEHLLGLGHRRIAFIGDTEDDGFRTKPSAKRRTGAAAAVAAAGAELVVRLGEHDREHAGTLARELFALEEEERPSAVFAASDMQALGVLEAAADAGLQVPGDVSVIGFDDIEIARYAGLTTVAQPLEESGTRGAQLLLDGLMGVDGTSRRMALRLVVRRTTGAPPAGSARNSQNTETTGTPVRQSRPTPFVERGELCRSV